MFLKPILALLIGYGILKNVLSRPPASLTSSCWGSIDQKPQQLLTETDIPWKLTWIWSYTLPFKLSALSFTWGQACFEVWWFSQSYLTLFPFSLTQVFPLIKKIPALLMEFALFGRSGLIHTATSNLTLNNPVQRAQALFPLQIIPLPLLNILNQSYVCTEFKKLNNSSTLTIKDNALQLPRGNHVSFF